MPDRLLIFGNSGAGKSTLAALLARERALAHLDLGTLAWEPATAAPARRPLAASQTDLERFRCANPAWVIEGCYADLLGLLTSHCTELIFLNPGSEACVQNCRTRPWEPHKYASKQAQDDKLGMLIGWVRSYETRVDACSLLSHQRLFAEFPGKKREIITPVHQISLRAV